MIPYEIFCDGGVVGPNPSQLGGVWAFCWVDEKGNRIKEVSGVVSPDQVGLPTITNNLTELLAVLFAIQSISRDWSGNIHTDSRVTYLRFTSSWKFNGIPAPVRRAVVYLKQKPHNWRMVLIAGHPTQADLEKGFKGDYPVSEHNVWADMECNRLAKLVKTGELEIPTAPVNWGTQVKEGFGLT